MRNYLRLSLLALAGWLFLADVAQAQYPTYRPTRPPVSPYLNIVRRGNSAAFNYLTLVRPELEMRGALQQLQLGAVQTQREINSLESEAGMPATGHATSFLSHGSYFLNLQGGRGTTSAQGSLSGAASDRLGSSAGDRQGGSAAAGSRRPTSGNRR